MFGDGAQQRRRVAGLRDDLDAGPLEEFRECLADQGRVVGQHQAQRHGGLPLRGWRPGNREVSGQDGRPPGRAYEGDVAATASARS